jgi:hypothetical protein
MRRPIDGRTYPGHHRLRDKVDLTRLGALSLVLGLITAVVVPSSVAGAVTDTVTNCSGTATDAGSLPFAVQNANAGDTINFSVSCPPASPIVLAGTLDIDVNLTLQGSGPDVVAVSGNNSFPVISVPSGVTTSVSGVTIENGLGHTGGGIVTAGTLTVTDSTVSGNNSSDGGGGIWNDNGSLTLTDSTVAANNTYRGGGGGVENDHGGLTIADSTLSANNAFNGGITIGGGGIENVDGTVAITDSTFSQNASDYNGGGGAVFNDNGTTDVTASTLAHNATHRQGGGGGGNIENEFGTVSVAGTVVSNGKPTEDCSGTVTDAGYNLDDDGSCGFAAAGHSQSDVKPYMGPMQDNGGPTETRAPALGSPVLNQIPTGATGNGVTLCPGTDQRGVSRPQGSACDIGAVELSPTTQTITSPDGTTATLHAPLSFTVTTTGTPTPNLTENGKLPKRLRFVDNGDGTATISGPPRATGRFHLTIAATFGTGASAFVVTQAFTLTVVPAFWMQAPTPAT